MLQQSLAERLQSIKNRITAACASSGRLTSDVLLLAVSKKQPDELIEEAYALGVRDFGENYVQELVGRRERLAHLHDARWHLIGPLQSNKVRIALEAAHVFHAADSLRLLQEIQKRNGPTGNASAPTPWPVYLQVNIDSESSKSGFGSSEIVQAIKTARSLNHIQLLGLMAIPAPKATAEDMRPSFKALKSMAQAHQLTGLSMGMSDDFDVAIQEGASVVRVGSLLFGQRPVKPGA